MNSYSDLFVKDKGNSISIKFSNMVILGNARRKNNNLLI
jgi:hypothetical protein